MENTKELCLDGKIEDLIRQLEELVGRKVSIKSWRGDNKTNIPDQYGIKMGGYFNGKTNLHKVEIIITPNKK